MRLCLCATLPCHSFVKFHREGHFLAKASTNDSWSLALRQLAGGLAVLAVLGNTGCLAGHPQPDLLLREESRLVDLTHSFGADTIVWPTEQDFRLVIQHEGETAGGYYYASNRLEMAEHGGTHMDAPIHFVRGRQTLDQVPLDRVVGTGIRIDVSAQCARDRDYRVTIADFERWESMQGRIPTGAIVLVDSGFARFWPSRKQYLGTALRGPDGVRALHFPGVHPDAAAWLVRERQIHAIGIDTASIDYGQSSGFETHITLLSQNVPVFENLADLRALPDRGFTVIALPMKIAGGSGGPLRVIAVIPPLP